MKENNQRSKTKSQELGKFLRKITWQEMKKEGKKREEWKMKRKIKA